MLYLSKDDINMKQVESQARYGTTLLHSIVLSYVLLRENQVLKKCSIDRTYRWVVVVRTA